METRVTECGNVIEVVTFTSVNHSCNTKVLSKDEYLVIETGEVLPRSHSLERSLDVKSLSRTFKALRDIINLNFYDTDKILWITLTYAENMTDASRLYSDFSSFRKRLVRRVGKFDYVIVVEPQQRGAWHVHGLLRFEFDCPYIANDVLREVWGLGFVKVNKVKDIDNLGAYLSAYLTNVKIDFDTADCDDSFVRSIVDSDVSLCGSDVSGFSSSLDSKSIVKGGRLHRYPKGMRIFRCSKNIKRPSPLWMSEASAKDIVEGLRCTYVTEREVTTKDGYKFCMFASYYNKL